jgi:TPR repeat protein
LYPYDQAAQDRARSRFGEAYKERETLKQLSESTGNVEATYQLGLLFSYFPDSTPEERSFALEYFRKAAAQGHISAQRELGQLYEHGKGVSVNAESAVYCYQSASKGGDARAMFLLGSCFARGFGIIKNESQALHWYQLAADRGDVLAQNHLGSRFEAGNGVPKDIMKAVHYYQIAADQGYGTSQFNIGVIYENGRLGEKDLVKAAQYYHLAVAQNIDRAMNNLASLYERGSGGLPQDYSEAFKLYEKSAKLGYARAKYNIGLCYEFGRGTTKDLELAKLYYIQASANPNERIAPEAKARLAQLQKSQESFVYAPSYVPPPYVPSQKPF